MLDFKKLCSSNGQRNINPGKKRPEVSELALKIYFHANGNVYVYIYMLNY